MTRSIGMILLCIYLALVGLFAVTSFTVVWGPYVVGFLAIAAAIFLALGK